MGVLVSCLRLTFDREAQVERNMKLIAEARNSVQLEMQAQLEQKLHLEQQIENNQKEIARVQLAFKRRLRSKEETLRDLMILKRMDMNHSKSIARCQEIIIHYNGREQDLKQFALGIVGQQRINIAFKKLAPLGLKMNRVERDADEANDTMDRLKEFSVTHTENAMDADPLPAGDLQEMQDQILKDLNEIEEFEADKIAVRMVDVPLGNTKSQHSSEKMRKLAKAEQMHTLLEQKDQVRSDDEDDDDDDDECSSVTSTTEHVKSPFECTQ